MSQLQLALLAVGAVVIVLVLAYNMITERRARRRAEQAFAGDAGDALFERTPTRREPTLGELPPSAAADDDPVLQHEEVPAPLPEVRAPEELQAPGGPAAQISSRIDTVAVILADDPIMEERLDALYAALAAQ